MAGSGDKTLDIKSNIDTKAFKTLQDSLKALTTHSEAFKKNIQALTGDLKKLDVELQNKVKDLTKFKEALEATNKVVAESAKLFKQLPKGFRAPGPSVSNNSSSSGGANYSYTNGTNTSPIAYAANAANGLGGNPNNPLYVSIVGGGGNGQGGNNNNNNGAGRNSAAFQAGAIIGIVGQAISTLTEIAQRQMAQPLQFLSQQQQFRGQMLSSLAKGDWRTLEVLKRPSTEGGGTIGEQLLKQTGQFRGTLPANLIGKTTAKIGAGAGAGALGGSFIAPGPGTAIGAIGGGLGGLVTSVSDIQAALNGKFGNDAQEFFQKQLAAEQAKTPYKNSLTESIIQNAGSHLQAARRLGGNEMQLRGGAEAAGMSPAEAFQAAISGANKFGARAMIGGGIFNESARLSARGFNQSATTDILGGLNQAVGSVQASRQLEQVLKDAFAGGLRDVALAEQIGQAVAENISGPGGFAQDLTSLSRFMSAGMEGAGPIAIQARQGGLGKLGGGGLAGAAPALEGLRFNLLRRQMGSNFDPLKLNVLSNATPQELISGSTDLANIGMGGGLFTGLQKSNPEAYNLRKKALYGAPLALLERLTTGSNIGGLAEGLHKKAMAAGGFENLFAQDPQSASLAGTLVKNSLRTGSVSSMEAEQFFTAFGAGGNVGAGSLPGVQGGGGSLAQKNLEAFTAWQTMVDSMDPSHLTNFVATIKNAKEAFSTMKEQVFNAEDFEKTANAVTDIVGRLSDPELAKRLNTNASALARYFLELSRVAPRK